VTSRRATQDKYFDGRRCCQSQTLPRKRRCLCPSPVPISSPNSSDRSPTTRTFSLSGPCLDHGRPLGGCSGDPQRSSLPRQGPLHRGRTLRGRRTPQPPNTSRWC
jgi:hypothetical protein